MLILEDPKKVQQQCELWRAEGENIVLVPTMGYFHAGHESLMQEAAKLGSKIIVSLFINPSQFAPNEDLSTYPRDIEKDTLIATGNGVDLLFTPSEESMYPEGYATWVEVPHLSKALCGKSRPTHFRGVCTVVLKLFMITQAHYAIFGQKDWQQLAILTRMAKDLNLTTKVKGMPIVREADGLALSSRNKYLSEEERAVAPHIRKGLELAWQLAIAGEKNAAVLTQRVREYWQEHLPMAKEDYLELVHPDSLEEISKIKNQALMATAIHIGKTRLIDNILIKTTNKH